MDYGLPNVNIEHFSRVEPYDGDFSTLFIIFSKTIDINKPILLTKFSQFITIKELENEKFLKKAVDVFFRNGGDRLYLLFYKLEDSGFRLINFKKILTRECDRLNDVEVISAINLYDKEIYKKVFNLQRVVRIQKSINRYCQDSHKISITDINQEFKKRDFELLGKTVIYYPWIVTRDKTTLPPSIYASALFSKMAKNEKYFESIANKNLYEADDIEILFQKQELANLVKQRVNPVINMPHRGVMFWGVKTFGENQDTVNELRVMKFIKRRLIKISQMYVFEPNSFILEMQIITIVKSFLERLEKNC